MVNKYITTSEKPIGLTQEDIRRELAKIGVSGLAVDIRWDVNTGAVLVSFQWEGKAYERKCTSQPNVSKNIRVIYQNLKQKVLDHNRGVEPFGDSMFKYQQLTGNVDTSANFAKQTVSPEIAAAYVVIEVSPYDSFESCEKAYHQKIKAWHPDRFIGDAEMQKAATDMMAKINNAWAVIKQSRGKT